MILISFSPVLAEPSSFGTQTVDNAATVGGYTSIALDSSNNPHISYYDLTNGDLKYARWTGSAWSIQTVDNTGNVGEYTSIAIDDNGRPHISYYDDSNKDLKYSYWTGSAWSTETVDSTGHVGGFVSVTVGEYTSIAIDDNGRPHISYYGSEQADWETYETYIKYAYRTGENWIIETVDSNYAGSWTSVALDLSGYAHISYGGGVAPLKYANWTGSAWSTETVDSTLGGYTSIAIDDNGRPHISYYDLEKGHLKYARLNTAPALSSGIISPSSGGKDTIFTYEVTYVDNDGDEPSYIRVCIDNAFYPMARAGGVSTSGALYNYTGTFGVGEHTFYFEASDGFAVVRLPTSGSYDGPNITAPGETLVFFGIIILSGCIGVTIVAYLKMKRRIVFRKSI